MFVLPSFLGTVELLYKIIKQWHAPFFGATYDPGECACEKLSWLWAKGIEMIIQIITQAVDRPCFFLFFSNIEEHSKNNEYYHIK